MFRFLRNSTKGNFEKFSKFSRKFGSNPESGAEKATKSSGGFLKSGLVILGGFYGYKYFTGDLEDINLYHVKFLVTILMVLVHKCGFKNSRSDCSSSSSSIFEEHFLFLVRWVVQR